MSEEKTKITIRLSKSVYDFYKDRKNYQAIINSVLLNEVELESDTYGYNKIYQDKKLTELHEAAYHNIQKIRNELNREIPYGVKENDGLAKISSKLREHNALEKESFDVLDAIKEQRDNQKKEIIQLYSELIDAVDARVKELLPRKYNYINMYGDELNSGKDECTGLIVAVIKMMERYFIGDLYYKDTSFSLKSLSEDDYNLALIRFYTLIIFVLDTVEGYDVWDDYIKIIEEERISKKRILEFVFYPIFEMQQAEIEAETEANKKFPEFAAGLHYYNVGFYDSFEAQILSSFMLNCYIKDSVDTIELENKKFKGIDVTIGIEELKDRPFYDITEVDSKTTIKFLPKEHDDYYSEYDMGYMTIEEIIRHKETMLDVK